MLVLQGDRVTWTLKLLVVSVRRHARNTASRLLAKLSGRQGRYLYGRQQEPNQSSLPVLQSDIDTARRAKMRRHRSFSLLFAVEV